MRLSFDGFDLDLDAGQLFRAGHEVPLERRALEMLCYLAQHPGRLITKDELLSEVWRARTLSDGVLSNTAAKLRKALGQAAGAHTPIETVRGRGFRWHAARIALQPSAAGVAAAPADPFVGRASTLAGLERALDAAAAGQAQLLLITGEAGIGKTRTLDELSLRAQARGFSVWQGAAYDGGGAPAYWPWIEVLRAAHADLSPAMFRRHLAADSWAMSLLVPELVRTEPLATSAENPATRFRLFDEVARFIAAASGEAPRLIALDDLHWADDGSLELLAYAARALKKRAVVLAVTLREHARAASEALQRLGRQALQITLTGLSQAEVAQLASELGDRAVLDARVSEALYQRTQGNPFFVRQTLALLAPGGRLDLANLERLGLPQAVRDILRQRIQALGSEARSVLLMAAALGAEFDAQLLALALDRPLTEVLSALEPAHRKAVVIAHPSVPHRFGFGHALLRDALYGELDLSERGALHARLTHVLEQRSTGDARQMGELARHALLAAPSALEACVRHCRNAADAARSALGFELAAEFLARADDKLASEGGDERTRCELLLALGFDRFCVGDYRGAWRSLSQGAVLAERVCASDLLARFACHLAAWLELGGGDEDETRRLLSRALEAVGQSDPDLRARLLARRAEVHFELSAPERYALLAEADALAARRNTPRVLIELALCRASLRDPTDLEHSRRAAENYRALSRRLGHELPVAERLLQSFAVDLGEYARALTACDLAGADGAIERCRRVAEESQVMAVALAVEVMQAGRALGDGRLDDVAAAVQRLAEAASMAGGFGVVSGYYALRLVEAKGGIASLAGAGADLSATIEELRPSQRMNAALFVARLKAKLGEHERARALLASIPRAELERMPVRYGDLGMLCFLAETYEALGDEAGAAALYPRLLPYAKLNAVGTGFDYGGAVAGYLGILARCLGQHAQAEQHFADAREINHRLGMPALVS